MSSLPALSSSLLLFAFSSFNTSTMWLRASTSRFWRLKSFNHQMSYYHRLKWSRLSVMSVSFFYQLKWFNLSAIQCIRVILLSTDVIQSFSHPVHQCHTSVNWIVSVFHLFNASVSYFCQLKRFSLSVIQCVSVILLSTEVIQSFNNSMCQCHNYANYVIHSFSHSMHQHHISSDCKGWSQYIDTTQNHVAGAEVQWHWINLV